MKVSIITPFFNGSRFIGKCIDCIQAQTFLDFEHIIVNDGSKEDELNFLKKGTEGFNNVFIFSQKNRKQAAAINNGLRNAGGEYIAFCDQDDWFLSEKIAKQVEFLDKHKDIDLVYSDALLGDEGDRINTGTWMQSRRVSACLGGCGECIGKLFERNFICAPLVVMVRKKALDSIGGINEKYASAYDYDLWFRLLENGSKFGYINESLAVWRSHSQNESRNVRMAKSIQIKIISAFLLRNKMFFFKNPLLSIKKFLRISFGFLISYNPYSKLN